jgi:hypothetical protein
MFDIRPPDNSLSGSMEQYRNMHVKLGKVQIVEFFYRIFLSTERFTSGGHAAKGKKLFHK